MKKIKVTFGNYGIGSSDLIPTFCCSSIPCYFVEFPSGYSGYFSTYDCEVV